jgi:tetratricopeptide (TPR) repeat protein
LHGDVSCLGKWENWENSHRSTQIKSDQCIGIICVHLSAFVAIYPVHLSILNALAYGSGPGGSSMRGISALSACALCIASCIPALQNSELVTQYNEDGVLLFERGDYVHAQQSFEAAQKLAPDDSAILYNLAQCSDRQGDSRNAEILYRECLLRAPNHGACRHSLAQLWVRSGRQVDAERMIEDWLIREPKLSGPYAEDGWLWHLRGDLPKAHSRLQSALQIDPRDVRALTELGQVYEELQRPDRALVLYQRILEVNPRQPEIARRIDELKAQGVIPPKPE